MIPTFPDDSDVDVGVIHEDLDEDVIDLPLSEYDSGTEAEANGDTGAQGQDSKDVQIEMTEDEGDDDFVGFVTRPRVISKFPYGRDHETYLVELEGAEKVNGSIFIEGVSGVGVTATVVSAYMIKELDLPLVAVFTSPHLPAMCSIHTYRATPPLRIYGDADVCVAVGDIPVSPSEKSPLIWQMTQALTDFARRHKCRHIVTIEAFPVKNDFEKEMESIEKLLPKRSGTIEITADIGPEKEKGKSKKRNGSDKAKNKKNKKNAKANSKAEDTERKEPQKEAKEDEEEEEDDEDIFSAVKFISCHQETAQKLLNKGHKPIKTGQIIGLTGAMISWSFTASRDDPPLTAILAPDPVKIPDQRGALLAVQVMRELFALADLDTSSLESEAKRLADKIHSTLDNIREQIHEQLSQLRPKPPPRHMYM